MPSAAAPHSQRFWNSSSSSPDKPQVLQVSANYLTGTPLKQIPLSPHSIAVDSRQLSYPTTPTIGTRRSSSSSGEAVDMSEFVNASLSSAVTQSGNPKYKTEMCRSALAKVECKYRDICQFAHTESELRYRPHNSKYKTVACTNFHKLGYCNYGRKCDYLHNEASMMPPNGSDESKSNTPTKNCSQLKVSTTCGVVNGRAAFGCGSDGDSPVPSSLGSCDSPSSRSPDLSDEFSFIGYNATVGARNMPPPYQPAAFSFSQPPAGLALFQPDHQARHQHYCPVQNQQQQYSANFDGMCEAAPNLFYHAGGNSFYVKYQ